MTVINSRWSIDFAIQNDVNKNRYRYNIPNRNIPIVIFSGNFSKIPTELMTLDHYLYPYNYISERFQWLSILDKANRNQILVIYTRIVPNFYNRVSICVVNIQLFDNTVPNTYSSLTRRSFGWKHLLIEQMSVRAFQRIHSLFLRNSTLHAKLLNTKRLSRYHYYCRQLVWHVWTHNREWLRMISSVFPGVNTTISELTSSTQIMIKRVLPV